MKWLTKGVPLCKRILLDIPKREIMYSLMKFTIAGLVAFFKVMASTHLVKHFVAARIHVYPFEVKWMGPIRLKAYLLNGHGVTILRLLEYK